MHKLFLLSNLLLIMLTSCSADAIEYAPFQWWSIYSPTRDGVNIDNEWALWGHNIRKAIPMTEDIQATTADGKKTDKQYCFSCDYIYNKVCEYITDNGGKDFTIAPLDNDIVCQCKTCKKAGNTTKSATPAVWSLLKRLSEKFPDKHFFTIAYKTCEEPVADTNKKSNCGVFISAIKLPMRRLFKDTEQFKKFDAQVQQWKNVTDCIYVWDYDRNYDDYFTPYPCLKSLQDRLIYYHEQGIRGVFINDSGDDYASFGDLQSAVIAKMLKATTPIDINEAVEEYCRNNYPYSCKDLVEWYLSMENEAYKRDHAMQFYAGIDDAKRCWLIPEDFETYWSKLDGTCKEAEKDERHKLSTLLTALCMTRAEIIRSKNPVDKAALENVLEVLDEYKENPKLQTYNEVETKTADYLEKARK